jgi:hypothetical protein
MKKGAESGKAALTDGLAHGRLEEVHVGSLYELPDGGLHTESRRAGIDKDNWVGRGVVDVEDRLEDVLSLSRWAGVQLGSRGKGVRSRLRSNTRVRKRV